MDNIRISKVENVTLGTYTPPTSSSDTPKPKHLVGTLHLTPHHLFFSPLPSSEPSSSASATEGEIWISYPAITLLTRLPQTFEGKYPIAIRTRGFESYVFGFEKAMEGGAEDVWASVKGCAVAASVEQLYAFFYSLPTPSKISTRTSEAPQAYSPLPEAGPSRSSSTSQSAGWTAFNPRSEFARQGVGSRTKAWRFTDINKDYSFCPTYPAKLVVPSRISDSVLAHAGKYRSKGRIPSLTYLHWANQASITRSSQPMVGLKNSRSAQDERLAECIFTSHLFSDTIYANPNAVPPPASTGHVYGATSTNLIIDARPTANAMANVAVGAGTENMENYKAAKKAYLGIDNIHVMRNSLKTISEAIRETEMNSNVSLDRSALRKSNWLKHTSTILDGALIIIKNIHLNASHVLIHCSDGWDRTAQLSAIAQLCLDPYYRTFEGFKVLVEKDWLAFGHKFLDRSGHLSSENLFTVVENDDDSDTDEGGYGGGASKAAQAFFASVQKQFNKGGGGSHAKEVSPVFHQFLDCVRQIQRQFPERFEFNEDWLLDLFHHLYSCQFGTFLFNNEKERRVSEGSTRKPYIDRTVSIWDYYDLLDARSMYSNPEYRPELDDKEYRDSDQGVLMYDPRDVQFWFRLFKRGDEEMNGSKFLNNQNFQAQGADMVVIEKGQMDPVSMEGIAETIGSKLIHPTESNNLIVEGQSTASREISRSASPASINPTHRSSTPVNKALNGPSHKDTFRAFDNSSSAFSLQTQNRPSPDLSNGNNEVSSFPSTGLPLRSSKSTFASTSPLASSSSWNWSQLSTGAYSALSRGAKEIKNIGEGAYNQIKAEYVEGKSEVGNGDNGVEPGTGIGEGLPKRPLKAVRLPSESNPWSVPVSTPTQKKASTTLVQETQSIDNGKSNERSWNGNPWGEPQQQLGQPYPIVPSRQASGDSLQRSLAGLKLDSKGNQANGVVESKKDQKPVLSNEVKEEQLDEEMYEAAMGGDSKAWDPLGAS